MSPLDDVGVKLMARFLGAIISRGGNALFSCRPVAVRVFYKGPSRYSAIHGPLLLAIVHFGPFIECDKLRNWIDSIGVV